MPNRPRDPRMQPLEWTDAELDAFTSPEALAAAADEIAQAWQRDAAPADRGMIGAPAVDDSEGRDATA